MVPNLGWRPGRLRLNIATIPVTTQPSPASTWTASSVKSRGDLKGISMPAIFKTASGTNFIPPPESSTTDCRELSELQCFPGETGSVYNIALI